MFVKLPSVNKRKPYIFYPKNFYILDQERKVQVDNLSGNVDYKEKYEKLTNEYATLNSGRGQSLVIAKNYEAQFTTLAKKYQELKDEYQTCSKNIQVLNPYCDSLRKTTRELIEIQKQLNQKKEKKTIIETIQTGINTNLLLDNLKKEHADLQTRYKEFQTSAKLQHENVLSEKQQMLKQLQLFSSKEIKLDTFIEELKRQMNTLLVEKRNLSSNKQQKVDVSTVALEQQYDSVLQQKDQSIITLKSQLESLQYEKQKLLDQLNVKGKQESVIDADMISIDLKYKTLVQEKQQLQKEFESEKERMKLREEEVLSQRSTNFDSLNTENINLLEKIGILSDKDINLKKELRDSMEQIKQLQYQMNNCSKKFDNLMYSKVDEQLENEVLQRKRIEQMLDKVNQDKNQLQIEFDRFKLESASNIELENKLSEKFKALEDEYGRKCAPYQQTFSKLENLIKELISTKRIKIVQEESQIRNKKDDVDVNNSVVQYVYKQKEIYKKISDKIDKVTDGLLLARYNELVNLDFYNKIVINGNIITHYTKPAIPVPIIEKAFKKFQTKLMNLYEDIAGSVRVYVRIKPSSSTNNKYLDIPYREPYVNVSSTKKCPDLVDIKYGPFFGVIPDTFNNSDLYSGCEGTQVDEAKTITSHSVQRDDNDDEGKCCILSTTAGVCRVIQQIKENYHIVIFSYGYSGSGKTHSLFGNKEEPGITQLSIANSGAKFFKIIKVFELYVDKINFTSKSNNTGKEIVLYDSNSSYFNTIVNTNTFKTFIDKKGAIIPTSTMDVSKESILLFTEFQQNVDLFRTQEGRIKATTNNQSSSRSHIFYTIEFSYPNDVKGQLTVCDLGGKESPQDILEMFVTKPDNKTWEIASLMMGNNSIVQNYYVPREMGGNEDLNNVLYNDKKNYTKLRKILEESVYINESVNHLRYFFENIQNNGQPYKDNMVDWSRYGVNNYDPEKYLTPDPTTRDNILMYKTLTNLKGNSLTKFVMLCNVRQEEEYCSGTLATLKFADKIKST